MKLKISSFALMAIGILLVGYALFVMDISIGGDIVNLGLLNTRQNLVMLGGLGILGGIILFAASLLVKDGAQKEAEDLAAAKLKLEAARTNAQAKIEEMRSKGEVLHDRLLPVLRTASWLLFLAPLPGLYLLALWFFGPPEMTSIWHLTVAISLIYAPYGLRKYRKPR